MTSIVDVCNSALDSIGTRATISDLSENSAEALACKRNLDNAIDVVLRAAPWNFARAYTTLGLLKALPGTVENPGSYTTWNGATMPPPPWMYTYAMPTDCAFVRFVLESAAGNGFTVPLFSINPNQGIPFSGRPAKFSVVSDLDGNGNRQKVIATNQSKAVCCYTVRVTDPNVWDSQFYDAVTDGLASMLAMPLTGKKDLRNELAKSANDKIYGARLQDANEGLTIMDVMPDWLAARGGVPDSPLSTDSIQPQWGPLFSVIS